MKDLIFVLVKGIAMGAANVIPGVSGGTIAFVTGIYDRLISALKSVDLKALKLLFSFKFKEFADHIDLKFLVPLFLGVGIGLVSFGKLLKVLFADAPVFVWAFFFGLIVASVYLVGKTIKSWNFSVILSLLVGCLCAVLLAFIKPASESDALLYLFICGIVAMVSMLLPGLSGSFVLILLGNYQLIMLTAAPSLDFTVLGPVMFGAVFGFVILSRAISFCLNNYENQTIATLTGFVFGSLLIIWPWKSSVFLKDSQGEFLIRKGKKIVMGYDWNLPELNSDTYLSLGLMVLGIVLALGIDFLGNKFKSAE